MESFQNARWEYRGQLLRCGIVGRIRGCGYGAVVDVGTAARGVSKSVGSSSMLGHGNLRDCGLFVDVVERLALIGKKASGAIEDFQRMKMIKRIWPN